MDTKAQMQAVVDKIVGVPPETLPSPMALDPPWRSIFCRVRRTGSFTSAEVMIWEVTKPFEDGYWLARELVAMLPPGDEFTAYPSFWEMSGQFAPVDWLWPSWIPLGLLTLFGAAPGVGKSLVALDLARRIIQGEPFPDGAPIACPGRNVLLVDAEGTPALLSRRVHAWNIDPRRLFLMRAPGTAAGKGAVGGDALIDLERPDQQERLNEMCRTLEPALIIIDSLAAAGSHGESSLEGARSLLGFLSAVAEQWQVALLVIHHLRKRSYSGKSPTAPRVAADDLRGSSHLSAAARSVLALSLVGAPASPISGLTGAPPQPDFGSLRRLEVVKTNLCRLPPPLVLSIEGENVVVPTLHYSPLVEPPRPPTQTDLCARWLLDYLAAAGAPVKPADVVRAAAEAGFSRLTLYRARWALDAQVVDLGTGLHDPGKLWTLATGPPHRE
jgi:AAA domain